MQYNYSKTTTQSFSEALSKIKEELQKEEFGILTEVDLKETMKKKIDADYENYVMLGACNPSFADKVLQLSKEIGLLLPCNVIVYEESGEVHISTIVPTVVLGITDIEGVSEIAKTIEDRLVRAVDAATA